MSSLLSKLHFLTEKLISSVTSEGVKIAKSALTQFPDKKADMFSNKDADASSRYVHVVFPSEDARKSLKEVIAKHQKGGKTSHLFPVLLVQQSAKSGAEQSQPSHGSPRAELSKPVLK